MGSGRARGGEAQDGGGDALLKHEAQQKIQNGGGLRVPQQAECGDPGGLHACA